MKVNMQLRKLQPRHIKSHKILFQPLMRSLPCRMVTDSQGFQPYNIAGNGGTVVTLEKKEIICDR